MRGILLTAGLLLALAAPLGVSTSTSRRDTLATHAVSDTPWTSNRPKPRAAYGDFIKARRALEGIVRRALGQFADSAFWSDIDTSFFYRDRIVLRHSIKGDPFWSVEERPAPVRVRGRKMALVTVSASGPAVEDIGKALGDAGWAEDFVYGADGPDGTTYAYVCREALCYVQGSWDGGDDSDTTYVPAPGESIYLVCIPRR